RAASRRSHRRRADRCARRRAVDGLFLLRAGRSVTFARHVHGARSYRARTSDGACVRLSRLWGARLTKNGLQEPLPAARAADAGRLGARAVALEATRRLACSRGGRSPQPHRPILLALPLAVLAVFGRAISELFFLGGLLW